MNSVDGRSCAPYVWSMVTSFQTRRTPPHTETAADRAARIEREAAAIAQARAEIAAGQGIEDADLESWLDRLDDNADVPLPAHRPPSSLR